MPEHADHHEDRQEIRLRVTGTDNPQQDLDDLRAWLEREPWLSRRDHTWELRPQPTPTADNAANADDGDEPGPADMAVGVDDLILVIVGAIVTEVTKGMSIAVREWLRRRKEERAAGERPAVEVIGDGGPGRPDPGNPAHESGSTGED
ncbi:hypothetical protein [Streptomyces endophytica]|uniref:Uncharacterized protein n=1 Tax=Streptomyces endophytica TaxID=2991496 RepID=A0ABY6PEH9_9ACTN|nr:hypothetical protein [Streptomyces endophytica]UZJ31938.1 hypothetical protein OJ254_18730 [Streptomyces endophytica]